MTLIRADRVFETTVTTGLSPYTLAGATAGYQAFSSVCANADTVEYVATDDVNWEVGLGTWGTGNILTRTSIYASSNGGAAVNWGSGAKNVFCDIPAHFFANPIPALMNPVLTGDITSAGATTVTTLPTVNANVGTFQGLTVNAKGQVTAAANQGYGTGSVTSVSVTAANGVSGSVATATTTPAITLTLGAITPSSVAASGAVTGSNLSGTNTGDQTITLTGDVTGTGPGSFATTLATVNSNVGSFTNASVTVNAKGLVTAASSGSAPITSVTGTANRITSSGGATPQIDIAATYVGQSSLVTLGTITTGVWNAGAVTSSGGVQGTQITSTVATGTAPLVVTSTTRVSNLNVATAGTADTVTTNANLTGAVTSVGNATSLGSFTSAALLGALTDETGTGKAMFATSPTVTTSLIWNGTSSGTTTVQAAAAAGSTTLTLPAATDTLVGKATTDTLTNKTLTSPIMTTPTLGAATATSITFGGAVLSNYDTGNWTPVLDFGGGVTGITYSTQSGSYVRIGKLVYVSGAIVLTSKGSSTGNAHISGLPLASIASQTMNFPYYTAMATVSGALSGLINNGSSTSLDIFIAGAAGVAAATNANFTNTTTIIFNGLYSV